MVLMLTLTLSPAIQLVSTPGKLSQPGSGLLPVLSSSSLSDPLLSYPICVLYGLMEFLHCKIVTPIMENCLPSAIVQAPWHEVFLLSMFSVYFLFVS